MDSKSISKLFIRNLCFSKSCFHHCPLAATHAALALFNWQPQVLQRWKIERKHFFNSVQLSSCTSAQFVQNASGWSIINTLFSYVSIYAPKEDSFPNTLEHQCGSWHVSITQEHARNAESQALPLLCSTRICILTRSQVIHMSIHISEALPQNITFLFSWTISASKANFSPNSVWGLLI